MTLQIKQSPHKNRAKCRKKNRSKDFLISGAICAPCICAVWRTTSYEAEWGVRLILDFMLCTKAGETVLRLIFCRKNSLNDCSCCSSVKYCGEVRIILRNSRSSSLLSAPSRYIMSLRRKSCSLPNTFITRRSLKCV